MSINQVVISGKPTSNPYLLFSKKGIPFCIFMVRMPVYNILNEIPNLVIDDFVQVRSYQQVARMLAKVCRRDVEYVFHGRLKWDRDKKMTYVLVEGLQEIPREEEHFMEGSRKIYKFRPTKASKIKKEEMNEAIDSAIREMRDESDKHF